MDMEKDLSNMYKDETQESVNALKEQLDRINTLYPQKPFTTRDVVLDIIFLFVTTALAFGWMLLMLLIISFVTLSYIHMEIDMMLVVSAVFAAVISVVYIIKKVKKYRSFWG